MPKADDTPTISRRSALSLAAGSLAAAALPSGGSPDAELIGLCERYVAHGREIRRLDVGTHETGGRGISDDAYLELNIAADDALDALTPIPARSLQGIKAKAEALDVALTLEIDIDWLSSFEERADPHDQLARSIAKDIACLLA